MCRWRTLLPALVCLAAGTPAAWSYPTCLNLVPSAKSLEAGALSLQWEVDSSGVPADKASSHCLYAQLGVTPRLEIGADVYNVDEGPRAYANAKYTLYPEAHGMPALAGGIWNLGEGVEAQPYLVASRTSGIFGLHAGALRPEGKWEAIAGAGVSLGERWSLQADALTGPAGYTSLGGSFSVGKGLGVTLYHCDARQAGADYTGLNLSWQTTLFR